MAAARKDKREPRCPPAPSIYGLADPETGEVRYIGKANSPQDRLKSHVREIRRRRTPLYDWMRKLADDGGARPRLVILEAEVEDWREAERRLIAEARARGDRLLNLADGGDEPHCPTEVRSANGKRLVERLRSDPNLMLMRRLKRDTACLLRDGLVRNRTRAVLRELAEIDPKQFGLWRGLPDREEDEKGDPIGGYGKIEGGRYGAPLQANR